MTSPPPKPRHAPTTATGRRTPAATVCAVFGSCAEVARLLKLHKSTVWRWLRGGLVPSRYHHDLLDHAEWLGLVLTPDDLVRGRAAPDA